MTKILQYQPSIPSYYMSDVGELQELLKVKGYSFWNPYELYLAWSDFSDSYCASWLIHSEDTVDSFIRWMQ